MHGGLDKSGTLLVWAKIIDLEVSSHDYFIGKNWNEDSQEHFVDLLINVVAGKQCDCRDILCI